MSDFQDVAGGGLVQQQKDYQTMTLVSFKDPLLQRRHPPPLTAYFRTRS